MLKLQVNYFGGVIIIKYVKGYLENKTINDKIIFSNNALYQDNKITFKYDQDKITIQKIPYLIIRKENKESVIEIDFNKKNILINIKENNLKLSMKIIYYNIKINDEVINIKYKIIDTNQKYEFKLIIGDKK